MLLAPCLYGSVCVHFCVFVLFLVVCLLRYFRSLLFFCFGVDVEGLCFFFLCQSFSSQRIRSCGE